MHPLLKRKSKSFTPYQTQTLIQWFEDKPYLKFEEKHQLAKSVNISERRIQDWYRYRRSVRRKAGLLPKGEECKKKKQLITNMFNISYIYSIATIFITHMHTHTRIHAQTHTACMQHTRKIHQSEAHSVIKHLMLTLLSMQLVTNLRKE